MMSFYSLFDIVNNYEKDLPCGHVVSIGVLYSTAIYRGRCCTASTVTDFGSRALWNLLACCSLLD